MKNIVKIVFIILIAFGRINAQSASEMKVKYMITYDQAKNLFTAWVVPLYDTPNVNNPDTQEKGATAQFSIKVPKGFELKSLADLKGNWEKTPTKIGNQEGFAKVGIDPNFEYYIIGKVNAETNYGTFKKNEPTAVFTFQGTGGEVAKVTVLDSNDQFVKIADTYFSLNVQNSFYSRSGQSSKNVAKPLEQFMGSTNLKEIMGALSTQVVTGVSAEVTPENIIIAYPNPTMDLVNLKVFVEKNNADLSIDLVNGKGNIQSLAKTKGVAGINDFQFSIKALVAGEYFIRTTIEDKIYTVKVLKSE